ncbi:MAG: ParB/RepB/Spo0J family partition protein [Clostridia bacterium]|nr:ParB/RepB/Spo0J family partition protein [Clostridia bacterium]
MKKNNHILGKLFEKSSSKDREKVLQIDVANIRANLSQPRQAFDADAIVKLADSIRQYGILQPLTVRKIEDNEYKYELIAGERRLRASKMLGLASVPCLVVEVDDEVSAELALVENMLRENLGMFEQAAAFASLSEKFGLTQEQIAQKMSLSQSAVANKIRLLKLTPEERKKICDANLTERHARAFLRISNKTTRMDAISRVIKDKLNVAETEKYVCEILGAEKAAKERPRVEAKKSVVLTSDLVCNNIDRYLEKLLTVSDLVSVDRKEVEIGTIITLTVRKGVG